MDCEFKRRERAFSNISKIRDRSFKCWNSKIEGRGKIWKKECSKILHFKIRFKIQILDSEFKSAEKEEHFFEHLNFKFERAEEEKRNGGNFETFEDIILTRSSKIWFSFKFERGETFEDATCLKIGSRWKVFRKSGRKKGVKGGSLRGNSSIVSIQLDKFDPK